MPNLIQSVHAALVGLGKVDVGPAEKKSGAVSVRASIKPDYLVCLDCGQKHKMLKRHLARAHDMTPDQYRQDYGLPRDYPLVAPNYSDQRRDLAHAIGLGKKRDGRSAATGKKASKAPAATRKSTKPAKPSAAAAPRGRGRPRKASAGA